MRLETPGTRSKRRDILRSVYEDNMRMNSREVEGLQQSSPWLLWGGRVGLVLAGLLVLVGGFQVYQEIQAKEPVAEKKTMAAAPQITPVERIE